MGQHGNLTTYVPKDQNKFLHAFGVGCKISSHPTLRVILYNDNFLLKYYTGCWWIRVSQKGLSFMTTTRAHSSIYNPSDQKNSDTDKEFAPGYFLLIKKK